ncbi:MAG: hypothetical protein LBP86_09590 [Azoarcus sp.]|jgi:hypothetical protein|nr:hypothetical protein [Azoarcus sp.]
MMPRSEFSALCLLVALGLPAVAREAPAPAAPEKDGRDTRDYRFPARADSVAAAQNMAHAMALRDYCADARVSAEFVRARLARFSRMTGREETCRSLLDY